MIRTTPLPLLIDLLRLTSMIRNRNPRLLKNGLPGKRDLIALNQQLLSPKDLSSTRSFEHAGYLLFLYELGYQLDLFVESKGHLKPQPQRALSFFSSSYTTQQQQIRQAYLRMVLWNEYHQLPHLSLQAQEELTHEHIWQTNRVIQTRRTLLKHLPSSLQEPQPSQTLLPMLRAQLPSPAQKTAEQPYKDVFLSTTSARPQQATYPAHWQEVEGSFLRTILCQSMQWLGWISTQQEDDDTLFALNPDFFASQPDAQPEENKSPHPTEAKTLLAQPNMEILIFPTPQLLSQLYHIESFCLPVSGDQLFTYRLERKTFFAALQRGVSYPQCLQFLEEHSRMPLPENVRQTLRTWYQQCNQIVISRQGTILEASTPEELDQWQKKLQQLPTYRLDPTSLFIPAHATADLKTLIANTPSQHIDYQQPPPRSLNIDANLRIEVDPSKEDLFTHAFLHKIADLTSQPSHSRPVFQLSQTSLQRAQDNHLSTTQILDFLEQRARIFPSTARLRFDAFASQLGPIFAGDACVLLMPDAQTMERFLHEGGLGAHILRIGPAAAIIPHSHKEPVERILQSFSLPNHHQPTPSLQALWPPPSDDDTS